MKLRYVIMIAASVGITLGLFWGCVDGNNAYSQAEPVLERRMSVVDSIYTKDLYGNPSNSTALRIFIIKVDDKEYLVNSHGGIVEHQK